MTIDFFVHPEHASYEEGRHPNEDVYANYRDDLLRRLESSDFPVLIKGRYSSGIFEQRIPRENQLESASYFVSEFPFDLGEIHPKEWEKFRNLLSSHENEMMVVQGSNFGECTEGFAVQLFAYLFRNEHWHNWEFYPDFNGKNLILKKEEKLKIKHQRKGDFQRSSIRYGVVLHPVERK